MRHLGILASLLLVSCAGVRSSADTAPETTAPEVGSVALGEPIVLRLSDDPLLEHQLPGLDLAPITAEVQRRLVTLQDCYRDRLAERPDLSGQVVIHWGIDPAGAVMEQCITRDTVEDQAITTCVNGLVSAGPYPLNVDYALDVSYPFVFGAG